MKVKLSDMDRGERVVMTVDQLRAAIAPMNDTFDVSIGGTYIGDVSVSDLIGYGPDVIEVEEVLG